ncbi:hypothetical protein C8Q78DRAFT_560183 [Trametes maxima]|nr:hypothetical protein C8Q78DRAFT_560183 [Trametes maxima]
MSSSSQRKRVVIFTLLRAVSLGKDASVTACGEACEASRRPRVSQPPCRLCRTWLSPSHQEPKLSPRSRDRAKGGINLIGDVVVLVQPAAHESKRS